VVQIHSGLPIFRRRIGVAQLVRAHPTLDDKKGVRSVVQIHSDPPDSATRRYESTRIAGYATYFHALIHEIWRTVQTLSQPRLMFKPGRRDFFSGLGARRRARRSDPRWVMTE
jgi:hypothetical protein